MTELQVYEPPAAIGQYQAGLVMTADAAKALDDQVRACTAAVLRPGVDYGVIPGTGEDRKVLLKPGAEKLLQWFGFAYTMDRTEIDTDADGVKQGVTYRCTIVKRLPGGATAHIATCEGYAGYDEPKFFQSAEAAQAKAEARERMWAAKDKRAANPNKWKHLTEYRAPWNTIIKMAQKRALVGATVDATAAAGLFTQEEDNGSPPADDGSTWYEQALERVYELADKAAGDALYVEAAHAFRDGLCSGRQKDEIQNRVRKRQERLRTAVAVDVEDVAQAAGDAAEAPAEPAAGQPGDERHKRLVGQCQGHFKRLGFTDADRADRLWAAGKLAGVADLESLSDLNHQELAQLADALAKVRDRQKLEELLAAAGGGGNG